jgi:Family of unknown function (DUF6247)
MVSGPYSGGITLGEEAVCLPHGWPFALGLPSGGQTGMHGRRAGSVSQTEPTTGLAGEEVWVRVAEWATAPDLPERVELVRATLPDADRARFEQDLEQALDTARLTGDLGPLGHVVEGWRRVVFVRQPGGGRRPRRGCARAKSSRGRASRWSGGCDQPLPVLSRS